MRWRTIGSTSKGSTRVPGYHGREWLVIHGKDWIASHPGQEPKSRLKVFHTIKSDGAFAAAFNELPENVRLPFVSVELAPGAEDEGDNDGGAGDETKRGKRRGMSARGSVAQPCAALRVGV
jgi:hypothetical protein